jgi:hypothetical protein
VSADVPSPIPAVLANLGCLDPDRVADLRPYLDTVPDPQPWLRPPLLALLLKS